MCLSNLQVSVDEPRWVPPPQLCFVCRLQCVRSVVAFRSLHNPFTIPSTHPCIALREIIFAGVPRCTLRVFCPCMTAVLCAFLDSLLCILLRLFLGLLSCSWGVLNVCRPLVLIEKGCMMCEKGGPGASSPPSTREQFSNAHTHTRTPQLPMCYAAVKVSVEFPDGISGVCGPPPPHTHTHPLGCCLSFVRLSPACFSVCAGAGGS
jgi:hypothetical protein